MQLTGRRLDFLSSGRGAHPPEGARLSRQPWDATTLVFETRALLLTDIVDSTQLSEMLGDQRMAELWAAHDRVARDLLVAHGGREIDKTDGFLFLFDEPSKAVDYAIAYHRAVAQLDPPLRARAGLHVGPVILRENPAPDVLRGAKPLEVDGLAKPIAARVMSLAAAGQTLLTTQARMALGFTLPGPSALRIESHGHWRMKGIEEPAEIFEVGGDDAPFTPPPDAEKAYRVVQRDDEWLPVQTMPHSLPADRDAFVGRHADLRELARRLDDGARLVTVLGIGGAGKTRLVKRFGWTRLGDFPGGVWFCDLTEARSIDGIAAAVARSLDVPLAADPIAQLGNAIAGRGRCLVILDNFEQVARHAADTLEAWLNRAPLARFIATSREVLGLAGEEALALAPLTRDEAISLFEARAASAKRGFSIAATERVDVVALVELLDRLPLAIELAAARVRVMSPKTLVARMGERFQLLTTSGARRDRQATLRGAIDWSWDLLSDWERAALAQASVFESGFALDAIEAVIDVDPWPAAPWSLDIVQALVDKSLVRRLDDDRVDLMLSVREYAAERLSTPGSFHGAGPEGAEAAERRHAAHYAALGVDGAIDTIHLAEADDRRQVLFRDLDNLVSACRRATARGDLDAAVATFRAAWAVLERRGPFSLGVELAGALLSRPDLGPERRSPVLNAARSAARLSGHPADARAFAELALTDARASGDVRMEALALGSIGVIDLEQGRVAEAASALEAAIAFAHGCGDRSSEATFLNSLANLEHERGDMDRAESLYRAAIDLHRALGSRFGESTAAGNLAGLLGDQGRFDESDALAQVALEIARQLGDRRLEVSWLCNMAVDLTARGRPGEASAHLKLALNGARAIGDRRLEGLALNSLGSALLPVGDLDGARTSLEAALVIHREVTSRRFEGECLGLLGEVHRRQGHLDLAHATCLEGEALLRSKGDVLLLGRLLCTLGEVEHGRGETDCAERRWREAEQIARDVRAGVETDLGRALARVAGLRRGS